MSVYYGECFPACLWWRSGRGGVILSRKCSDFPAGFDYFCSMNRRNFCKALAAVAAMAATAPASAAAMTGNCGRRCRLTVVRRMWVEDLQARYLDDPEAGPCPLLNQGQSWLIDGPVEAGIPPRGMCGRAWAAIAPRLAESAGCAATADGGPRLLSCGDPTRAVIFRVDYDRV